MENTHQHVCHNMLLKPVLNHLSADGELQQTLKVTLCSFSSWKWFIWLVTGRMAPMWLTQCAWLDWYRTIQLYNLLLDVGEGEDEKREERAAENRMGHGDGAHALMRRCWVANQSCVDLRKKYFFLSHCQVIVPSFWLLMGIRFVVFLQPSSTVTWPITSQSWF